MTELRGKTFGGFRILEQIRDRDPVRCQTVCKAICVVEDPDIPVSSGQFVSLRIIEADGGSETQFERLKSRVARLARLNGHPNIVRHYGCFCCQVDGRNCHVVVQEYLDGDPQKGKTLKERLSKLRIGLDVVEGLRIVREVADALGHAAKFKVFHLDVRPENIFICKDGSVKLVNFGVVMSDCESADGKGCLHGSFEYAAPDFLCPGFCGDEQSDVFSLGVVFHQVISGKFPFISELESGEDGWRSRWQEWSNGAENADTPVFVYAIAMRLLNGAYDVLEKALEANRAKRYATFEALGRDLAKITFCEQRHGDKTYRWLQCVGKGGFGEVFKALWVEANRFVAVKRLLNIEFAERFRREAKVMQKLQGSGFVQFIDFFETADQAFLVMQFLDGMPGNSLRDAISRARDCGKVLPKDLVFAAFERYARGLSLMHRRKIIHRDIKPSNLYYPMGRPDRVAIMDFGIVRVEGALTTMTGDVMTPGMAPCTPDYAPAEIIEKSEHGGPGMDIFALGLCMYEALTGHHGYARLPEGIAGMTKLLNRCKSKEKPVFNDPRVRKDPELLKLLRDMTNPDLSLRLKDADEVAARIRLLFYREASCHQTAEGVTLPTVVFDPMTVTDKTIPIDEKEILMYRRKRGGSEFEIPSHDSGPWSDRLRMWRFRLAGVALAGTLVGGMAMAVGPWVKKIYAESELEGVLEACRNSSPDATDKENAWIVEFNPQSYSWLRLDAKQYASCTNAIYAVKLRARADKLKRDFLSRVGGCLSDDGRLKVETYAELNGWSMPDGLDGDDGVRFKLDEIGRAVMAELKACVDIGDIKSRRERLKAARDILENRWTPKVLDAGELRRMKSEVDEATDLCVGRVHNRCKDAITVCGERIVANETRTIIVKDGRPERQMVTRTGYKPIPLPTGFDGMAFEVDDSSFVIKPIRFSVPKLGDGLRFFLKDHEYAGGEEIELEPGRYIARYARDDRMPSGEKMYKDYLVEFSVTANADVKIPDPGNWEETEPYAQYLKERLAAERRTVQDELENLLRLEPIKGRRNRIEEAKKLLQEEKTRRIFAKDEIEERQNRVQDEAHWVVGQIRNDCDFKFIVGDATVAPGESRVIKYDDRQSQGMVIKARGYVDRELAKELDEADLAISSGQWTMADVWVTIEGAAKGVKCVFNGGQVDGGFKVVPGSYSLVFKREGYESQSFAFTAKPCDGCTVTVPSVWSPLPVDVSVPDLDDDVKCFLGTSQVSRSVRLTPGKSYEFRYQKDDCEDQRVRVPVEAGTPAVVPGPSVWVDVADVKSLGIAEQLVSEGKLDEAAKKVEGVKLKSSRNVGRLRVVKDKIKKAAALKESVSLAQGAFLQEDWYECIRYYYVAHENGYVLNATDRANVETAFAEGMEELKAMLKKALHDISVGRTPIRDPDAIRKDMRQLNEWHAAIRKL